jgi:hypothetical protein
MARRILAAFTAAVAVLILAPARLSGEPTTSRPRTGPPSTTTSSTTTTSTTTTSTPTSATPPNPHAVNRDVEAQAICGCDFFVWTRAGGLREADVVTGPTVSPEGEMRSGARREGDVYLYVGKVRGPYFILFDPDRATRADYGARAVWRARV